MSSFSHQRFQRSFFKKLTPLASLENHVLKFKSSNTQPYNQRTICAIVVQIEYAFNYSNSSNQMTFLAIQITYVPTSSSSSRHHHYQILLVSY